MISTSSAKSLIKQKIFFLGDESVGKTAIISRFVRNQFIELYKPTIGYDFISKTFDMEEGLIQLEIWDSAGQDKLRFKELAHMIIKGYQAAIICYDITNEKSFQSIPYWIEVVKKERKNNALIFVIGCKCDLEEQRMVPTDQAMAIAQQHEAEFSELSALNTEAVNQLFQLISKSILKQCDDLQETSKCYQGQHRKQSGCVLQ